LTGGKRQQPDSYDEVEAERRFLAALKAGLNSPAKPLKAKTKLRKKKAKPVKG
jgi:hypothetical protein